MPVIIGPILRPYGEEAIFDLVLFDRGDVDFDANLVTDPEDSRLIKDEGTSQQTINPVVTNNGGYTIGLDPPEMYAKRIALYIVDVSTPKKWVDTALFIETYGHADSQHPSIGLANPSPLPTP